MKSIKLGPLNYHSRIGFSYHCLEITLKSFYYEIKKRNTNKQTKKLADELLGDFTH